MRPARCYRLACRPATSSIIRTVGCCHCQRQCASIRRDQRTNGQAGGQPRTFDAEQHDEARRAVCFRPVEHEVGHRLPLAVELRPDAGVVGMQARGVEPRIVAADEIEERGELFRLERIVDRRDPLDVGAELAATADVDRAMQAEPRALRHGIDVPRERRAARQRIVLADGIVGRRRPIATVEIQCRGERGRVQPARHHEVAAGQALVPADLEPVEPAHPAHGADAGSQHDLGAVCGSLALQRQHVGVAVDDTGRWRQQRRHAIDLRLEPACLGRRQRHEIVDAVGDRGLVKPFELAELVRGGGHQQFRAPLVRHAAPLAEPVELVLALDAQLRAQTAGRIVDAGVDHLGVARGRLRADQLVLLEHHDLLARHRQRTADRQADHAGADDDGLDIRVHGGGQALAAVVEWPQTIRHFEPRDSGRGLACRSPPYRQVNL